MPVDLSDANWVWVVAHAGVWALRAGAGVRSLPDGAGLRHTGTRLAVSSAAGGGCSAPS